MSELRDPLDRVSNSLRRAVSINKNQETDLRSTMSTIQRERRRSVNSWSLKQEKFLRSKQKFMPALKPQDSRRPLQTQSMVTPARGSTLARRVSPESLCDMKPVTEFVPNQANILGNSLPPLIVPGKRKKNSHLEGRTMSVAAICNQFLQEPLGSTESQLRRAQRVSEYKAAMNTDGGSMSLQRRVRRFTEHRVPAKSDLEDIPERISIDQEKDKLPVRNGVEDVSVSRNVSRPQVYERRNESMLYRREIRDDNSTKQYQTLNHRDNNFGRRILPLPIQEEAQSGNKTAEDNWKKLRLSLKSLPKQAKPRDVSKMSLTEMTRLFEEIRECRYLRVGHNKSFRGDNAMGEGCKCLACTVKDKTKLKNSMSAPQ